MVSWKTAEVCLNNLHLFWGFKRLDQMIIQINCDVHKVQIDLYFYVRSS